MRSDTAHIRLTAAACLIAVLAIAAMTGCGSEDDPPPPAPPPVPETQPAATAPAAPATPGTGEAPSPPPADPAPAVDGDLTAEIAGIEALERDADFAEALRRAQNLRTEATDPAAVSAIDELIQRLRREKRDALKLSYAMKNLGSHRSEVIEVARDELAAGGEAGLIFLRKAVRASEERAAAHAAELLGELGDATSADEILRRLRSAENPVYRRVFAEAVRRLAPKLDDEFARRMLDTLAEDEAFDHREIADALIAIYREGEGGDAEAFNQRIGRADACQALKDYVLRAINSGSEATAEWGMWRAGLFGIISRDRLVLWLNAAAGITTDAEHAITKWKDYATDSDRVAYQNEPQHRPRRVEASAGVAAARFDGHDDYLFTPSMRHLFPTLDVTIAVWIRPTGPGVVLAELGQARIDSSWHDSQIEVLEDGRVRVRVWSLSPITVGRVEFGEWHHVALTYSVEQQMTRGYFDGRQVPARSPGQRDLSGGLVYAFGAKDGTNMGHGGFFNGDLAEVNIYNRPLPAPEIKALHDATNPLQ